MSPKKKRTKKSVKNSGSHSYKSLIYGTITVFVLFAIVLFGLRIFANKQKGQILKTAAETSVENTQTTDIPTQEEIYKTIEGDTLWSISEKYYLDGFRWGEIAKINNITDPTRLEKGQDIKIPNVVKEVAEAPKVDDKKLDTGKIENPENGISSIEGKITGNIYKIKAGDNLWDIAVRAYGDGYKWPEIVKANNLENPEIIHSDNVLKLPR